MNEKRSTTSLWVRKAIACVASLALALAMVPAVAFAADGGLYFGNLKFANDDDITPELTAAGYTVSGEASFDGSNTLHLKNFSYEGAGDIHITKGGAIESLGNLVIELEGTNAITLADSAAKEFKTALGGASITINGTTGTSLSVTVKTGNSAEKGTTAISANTVMVTGGCTVTTSTPQSTGTGDEVVSVGLKASDITVDNSRLFANGYDHGIEVSNSMTLSNHGEVESKGIAGMAFANTDSRTVALTTSGAGPNKLLAEGTSCGLTTRENPTGFTIAAAPYEDEIILKGPDGALATTLEKPISIVQASNTMSAFTDIDGTAGEKQLSADTEYYGKDMGADKENLVGFKNLRIANDQAPVSHTITINGNDTVEMAANDSVTLSGNNASQVVQEATPMVPVTIYAKDGYYLPNNYFDIDQGNGKYDLGNGLYATRDTLTNADGVQYYQFAVEGTPTTDKNITLKEATAAQKLDVPEVSFAANGPDSGVFNTYGFSYSIDGGVNWHQVANDPTVTGVTVSNGIDIKMVGDGVAKLDSDIKHIAITKPGKPSATPVNGGFTSSIAGLEYSSDNGATWKDSDPTATGGSAKSGLSAGTYLVRVKANGTALSSDAIEIAVTADPGADPGTESTPVVIGGVDMATAPALSTVQTTIASANTDKADVSGSSFSPLQVKAIGAKNKVTLKWSPISGVDGYIIYGSKCGSKMQQLATAKASAKKWANKKLKKGAYYKYMVVAYKDVAGTRKVVSMSKSVHAATAGGKKGNPSAISVKKAKMSVKAGKTASIKATVKSAKKVATHIAKVRYESSDTSIATVNKKGKVKGVAAGTAKVFVFTQNGLFKAVNVTVK